MDNSFLSSKDEDLGFILTNVDIALMENEDNLGWLFLLGKRMKDMSELILERIRPEMINRLKLNEKYPVGDEVIKMKIVKVYKYDNDDQLNKYELEKKKISENLDAITKSISARKKFLVEQNKAHIVDNNYVLTL